MNFRIFTLKRSLLLFSVLLFLSLCIVIIYGMSLTSLIEKRFSGRKWQLPSKVYSDTTILYPGLRLSRELFHKKLLRLNYREVTGAPTQKGEIKISPDRLDIFLYDAIFQTRKREGYRVSIQYKHDWIETMTRLDNFKSIPILELEPEEVMLFFGKERERRQLVSIQHVPEHFIKAVMAIEDARFYKHYGISPLGILRAMYTNLRFGKVKQGGSTITQQLSKNYFLTPERTISRKLKEILISLILEILYEKNEILEIYFNEIYLGQKGSESINGIGEASFFYFGKSIKELTLSESAVIAGLIKGPNLYSPYINPDASLNRRNLVLKCMRNNGWIKESEYKDLSAAPLKTAGFKAHHRRAPYFIDYLYKQLNNLYSKEDLESLGLSIYTTLDTQVQEAAENALKNGLERLENNNPLLERSDPLKKLQGAVIVIQPKTGYILAMVGGRNYSKSQFNRVTQARRQTGSAFKPFVFLSALDEYTPASLFSNEPQSYPTSEGQWTPQNFSPTPETKVRMRTALSKSHNRATVDLAVKTGLDKIIETARSFNFSTHLDPLPSLALGAFEAIPLELARAYCVFAADGVQPFPLSLKNVINRNNQILNRRQMQIERLISPAKAYIISSLLQSAVIEGTARSLSTRGIDFPVAGKTGTTSNYRDAWFVGYTPDILALIWVGFDNGDSIQATGSHAAMPIWADLLKGIPQHVSETWFQKPPGITTKKICAQTGLLASTTNCPEIVEELFLEDNIPESKCHIHKGEILKKIIKGIKDLVK